MNLSKTTIRGILATAILIAGINIDCQQPAKSANEKAAVTALQIELQTIDGSMANCYLKANADSLVGFYDRVFIYLPEDVKKFHPF